MTGDTSSLISELSITVLLNKVSHGIREFRETFLPLMHRDRVHFASECTGLVLSFGRLCVWSVDFRSCRSH